MNKSGANTDARNTAARLAAQINEIVSARGSNYGAPEDNFANIANFWNAWLHARYKCLIALDPVDVGVMSSLIKVARLAQTPGHEDSALDGAIYMLLGYGCGVSDREPGMSDEGFPEPVKGGEMKAAEKESWAIAFARKQLLKEKAGEEMKPNSVFIPQVQTEIAMNCRVLPYTLPVWEDDWHNSSLIPEHSRYIVTKFEELTEVWQFNLNKWSDLNRVISWRYATEEEISTLGDEELKPNSVFVEGGRRVIPFEVAQADNHWYCPPLVPDTSYNYFYATKWDGPLTKATAVPKDWLAWAKEVGVVKWRYPTQEELRIMGEI